MQDELRGRWRQALGMGRSEASGGSRALAMCVVAALACGDGSDDPGASAMASTPAGGAAVPSESAGATPAPAGAGAEAESPAAVEGAESPVQEAPAADVPLQAPAEPGGAAEGGMAAAGEAPAEPVAPEQPDLTPEAPAAFSPCPTDGSPCQIMPLGDSITFGLLPMTNGSNGGYRVELFRRAAADGHAISFVGREANGPTGDIEGQPFSRNHEGYSGYTIERIANDVAGPALAAADPDIVLLHIGTNNLYQGMPPNAPQALAGLIDQITEAEPEALVVVAQITPLGGFFPNNGVDEYNAAIPGIVQERVDAGKHVLLVNQFEHIAANPNFVQQLVPDNIHPNEAGYALMGDTWYAAIESVLP